MIFKIIYVITGIFIFFLGTDALLKSPKRKDTRIFFVLCTMIMTISMLQFLTYGSASLEEPDMVLKIKAVLWSFFYSVLLHFVLVFSKNDDELMYEAASRKILRVLIYIPASVTMFHTFIGGDVPVQMNGKNALPFETAGFDVFVIGYIAVYLAASLLKLLNALHVNSRSRRYKTVVLAFFPALLAAVAFDLILPTFGFDTAPPMTTILSILPAIAVYRTLAEYAEAAREPHKLTFDFLRDSDCSMVLTDTSDNIIDLSSRALGSLGYSQDDLAGRKMSSLVKSGNEVSQYYSDINSTIRLRTKSNSLLDVSMISLAIKDKLGNHKGHLNIFKDVTEENAYRHSIEQRNRRIEGDMTSLKHQVTILADSLSNERNRNAKLSESINRLAYYDHLTGLPNRRYFYEHIDGIISSDHLNLERFAIMFLDLDSFKLVNDSLGHDFGDELLVDVSRRLKRTVGEGNLISRFGGDEFLLYFSNIESSYKASETAQLVLDVLKEPFVIGDREMFVTGSLGVTLYPDNGTHIDILVKNADISMYNAKVGGKNKFEICISEKTENAIEEMQLTNQLYRAVENHEFEVYYQPQIEIETGRIIGIEALVRWNHVDRGVLEPGKFIGIAERTGLINAIGEDVLTMACSQNRKWQDEGLLCVPVAVNVSSRQFRDSNFVEKVSSVLEETGLEPKYLELEVTENILIDNVEYILETFNSLKDLGVCIALDDFGSEYSSLNYLKRLPFGRMKIDKSFIRGISTNKLDRAIINSIIALGENLAVEVVAEGVETETELEYLKSVECRIVQGFYYHPPLQATSFEKLVKQINHDNMKRA